MGSSDDEMLGMLRESASAYIADHAGQSPTDLWPSLTAMGWTGLLLTEQHGGAGLDLVAAASLLDEFGRRGFECPLLSHALLPSLLLSRLEQTVQIADLQAGIASGRPVVVAWQERPGQIDSLPCETRLVGTSLIGSKQFVPVGPEGAAIVSARDSAGELVLVLLPALPRTSDVVVPLADGSSACHVTLDEDVGLSGVIARGTAVQAALDRALAGAATLRAAQLSGLAGEAFERTRAFLQQRKQFGQSLAQFQVLQHRMVDLYMLFRQAAATWRSAAAAFDVDSAPAGPQTAASAAKARSTEAAQAVAKAAIQLHGAYGFTEEGGFGRVWGQALAWGASFGGADAHRRRFYTLSSEFEA